MFFKKNTLSLEEVVDAIFYIALMSLGLLQKFGKFADEEQRRQLWERRSASYDGSCSSWHASKICVFGDNLARLIASNDLLWQSYLLSIQEGHEDTQLELREEMRALAQAMAVQNKLI